MKEISIDGITYRSQAEAARAFNITRAAVCLARKRGQKIGEKKNSPRAVQHHFTAYPSISAAARATGRSKSYIALRAKLLLQGWSFIPGEIK